MKGRLEHSLQAENNIKKILNEQKENERFTGFRI